MTKFAPFFLLFLLLYCSATVQAQCDLKPVIMPNDVILCPNSFDTLYVTKEYDTYKWFRFSKAIAGATKRYLVVNAQEDAGALFKVQVTKGRCTDTSKKVLVDGYAFAGPTVATIGTPSYFDVATQTSVFCKNDSVSLYFLDPYNTNVQWYNNGKPIAGANSQTYNVSANGSYTVTGAPSVCPDYTVCQCLPVNIAIDKFTAAITRSGDTLFTGKGKNYQWFVNGNAIPGATSFYFSPVQKGLYTVEVSDTYNCTSTSKPALFLPGKSLVVISPNPARDFISVHLNMDNAAQFIISDVYGNRRLQVAANGNNERITIGNLNRGTYVLHVLDSKGNVIAIEKFMKTE